MPYTLDFPIPPGDHPLPPNLYRALHANLLRWIGEADPELADAIHDRPVRKPFTISPLRRGRDGGWRWRVALLQDDLWEPLWTGVQTLGALDLNGRKWPVRWSEARCIHRTYDLMLTCVRPDVYSLDMEFLSPTAFRAGDLDLPLPEPGAVFRSWLSRWNDFAPPDRRISTELLDVVHTNVAISGHRLRTEWHDLGRSQVVGFLGKVTFVITKARRLNQALVWQLNALADYAEFCGTGRKTTHGMGQTRRLRRGR